MKPWDLPTLHRAPAVRRLELLQDRWPGTTSALAASNAAQVGEQAQCHTGMIPGLEQAEVRRFGMGTAIRLNGPTCCARRGRRSRDDLRCRQMQREGYLDSAASGLIAGRNGAALASA